LHLPTYYENREG